MGAVERSANSAPTANIGLVQANLELEGTREQAEAGLRRHLQLTRELLQQGPLDLVVWSETSVPNAMLESTAARRLREEVTGELGVPSIVGTVLVRPVADARRYVLFNSAMLSDAHGELLGRYDKHFRLPFGEYLPLGDTFPILYEWSPASGRFAAGESREALKLGAHRLTTLICYEDVVAEYVRSAVRENEPDLLVNLTNDGWFGDTTEPWIHLALAQFRAVEHRRYLVRATNTGVSAIIDPLGRVVANTSTFVPATLRGRVGWLQGRTLYGLLGNTPWWIATLISVVWAFSPARKRISGALAP
jgi:apolipoprotein N-acyltransferase